MCDILIFRAIWSKVLRSVFAPIFAHACIKDGMPRVCKSGETIEGNGSTMNKTKIMAIIGAAVTFVLSVSAIVTVYRVRRLNVLPGKHMAALLAVLFILLAAVIVSQFFDKFNIVGDVVGVLAIAGLIFAAIAVGRVTKTLDGGMAAGDTKDTLIYVMVLKDAGYSSFDELKNATFGLCTEGNYANYNNQTVEMMKKDFGGEVFTRGYSSEFEAAVALTQKKVDAVIISSTQVAVVDDLFETQEEGGDYYLGTQENGENTVFTDVATYIKTYTITEYVEKTPDEEKKTKELISTSVTPFVVYISGIDVRGDISTVSRSDVNILMCVNPITKQIAMVTTPRDSYVQFPGVSGNSYDKLTHAGIYGKECSTSIATMEKLYGVKVDYYIKVNFTSVINIVEALGGVTVHSDKDFVETSSGYHYHYAEGDNFLNGNQTLAFSRERMAFADGDYQRGRNQLLAIQAILNKAMSPAILSGYSDILKEVETNFETNMEMSEITELVKMQIADGASWNFISYSVAGINNGVQQLRYTYSLGTTPLYVTILDEESIAGASDLMEIVLNGGTITQEQANQLNIQ